MVRRGALRRTGSGTHSGYSTMILNVREDIVLVIHVCDIVVASYECYPGGIGGSYTEIDVGEQEKISKIVEHTRIVSNKVAFIYADKRSL